jgi:hypothetical protein
MCAKVKTAKAKTAIFGADLRVELKKYPLNAFGNRIIIVDGGENDFRPEIGPTHFLDWPGRKRYFIRGPRRYERIFFSQKKAAKCVDFANEKVYGPDGEQLKKANMATLAKKIGVDAQKGTPWYAYLILLLLFGILIKVFAG